MLHELLNGLAVLSILTVLGLLLRIRHWPEWLRRARSASWPAISGVIQNGGVSTIRGRTGDISTAQLSYSYKLDGTYYSGYHNETFNDEQKAWSYVDALRGKGVQVSYNPRKPDISVLRRQRVLSL
jgi:hypothetical protein